MLLKLVPILLALLGLGIGVGAGIAFRPMPVTSSDTLEDGQENPCGDVQTDNDGSEISSNEQDVGDLSQYDFAKLNNQFVVPIVIDGKVNYLVVMSLTLQVKIGETESVFQAEPKLRDTLLQVMFDHANSGGFSGPFTEAARMNILRTALLEAAQIVLGDLVSDVLIIDVVRQDVG
jgi:hypothetical protein